MLETNYSIPTWTVVTIYLLLDFFLYKNDYCYAVTKRVLLIGMNP